MRRRPVRLTETILRRIIQEEIKRSKRSKKIKESWANDPSQSITMSIGRKGAVDLVSLENAYYHIFKMNDETGDYWPTVEQVADYLGVTETWVRNAIPKLGSAFYVEEETDEIMGPELD